MKALKFLGKEPLASLVALTILVCLIKFLMEGISFDYHNHPVSLGHADSLTYAALLGPILGAHSYTKVKGTKETPEVISGDHE